MNVDILKRDTQFFIKILSLRRIQSAIGKGI